MHALRDAGDRRRTVKIARDKVHLRISGVPEIQAANSKAAKSYLALSFHPVVRMKLFCVVAHLLHPFKAHVAFAAHVEPPLMRHLLVLHQFFDLAELASTCLTFMLFEHAITPCCSGCPSTFCTDSPVCARQAWGDSKAYPACRCR